MKNTKKILTFFIVFVAIYACSTKKDTIITRNYHALTTKYNILFNGEEAFEKGVEDLNNQYQDDWFQVLPIEPIDFEEDKIAPPNFGLGAGFGDANNDDKKESTTFDRAEEKAVKAIQKHGMNIDGIERNRQIDDAYFLLGKSRYYSQRFVPAIEAFNYVISNYPNANLIAETKIWRAKANIRIDNEETAIEAMNLLLFIKDTLEADLPNKLKESGNTALAMAYLKTDSLQKVKEHLQLATRTLENRNQGARNLFILGQMYAEEGKKDSAQIYFNKLINFKKAPYRYKIYANLELARNSTNDSTSAVLIQKLNKLIKVRENRPYLDGLYYQLAVLHEKNDSLKLAYKNYNKSLRALDGSDKQKTFTYENLGNLYFKESEYQKASAFYDSVLQLSTDSLDIRIRRVNRKYKNLASLIKYENTVALHDSILRIASLPKEKQTEYFTDYIAKIKKADEEAAQLRLNRLAFGGDSNALGNGKKGNWYFYNSQSLSFGKTEFKKIWGNRPLEDNWRWSDKITNSISTDSVQDNKPNERYNLESYISKIPTDEKVLDSLITTRNTALYELGLIYKEQFKNKKLAKERLERVASLNPDENLILPINWHLYQLYLDLGDEEKIAFHKNIILTKYPNTVFAQSILNPDEKIEEDVAVNEIEESYKEIYYLYKDNKYEEVVSKIDEFIVTIPNSTLLPKFQLLKAFAIGKFKDKEAYKKAMEFVAVSYGNTEEGKKAQAIVTQLNK